MKRFVSLSSLFLLLLLLSTAFHSQLASASDSQVTDKAQRAQSGQNVDVVGHLGGTAEAVFPDDSPLAFCDSVIEIPQTECEALEALYNGTDGTNWTDNSGWLATNTPCSWFGVTCSGGHVTQVELSSNELSGSMPAELGNLTNLAVLSLHTNALSGSIPVELGNLANLISLTLHTNQLSGSMPTELGNLTNLQALRLINNQLNGPIPAQLGNLTNLESLWLSNNQLNGPIPIALADLANLTSLYLDNNNLSGPIPAELGNLANLQLLYLHGNQLNGSIPAELGALTNLERLHLQSNQLNGFIPAALGNLANLQYLSVSNNQLNGPIPAALGNLANLQELYLQSNQLTGSIPTELGDLINLTQLRLNKNQLSGPIPLSFTNLTSLTQFYFHNTYLCTPDEAAFEDWLGGVEQHSNIEVRCPLTSLLGIYVLAFDSEPTSPANLSPLLYETMQSIVEATAGSTDRTALVLADQDGAADTNIFMVYDGNVTPIVGLPDTTGVISPTLNEYNMADGETLGGFLKWALANYATSETKTTFSYVSHGTFLAPAVDLSRLSAEPSTSHASFASSGPVFPLPSVAHPKSAFSDYHPERAVITPHALAVALEIGTDGASNPLDVLDIVHCFSGSIEEFYELSNAGGTPYAETIVGSANYSYFAPEMLGEALSAIQATDVATTTASTIVSAYDAALEEVDQLDGDPDVEHPRTFTVVESSKIPQIKNKLDEMAWYLAQEFDSNAVETKNKLTAAYQDASVYYDTTYCAPMDWELAPPDGLVDIQSFMAQIRNQFGILSGAGIRAGQVTSAVASAVITHTAQNGTPWMADTLTPTWTLDGDNVSGLALYADLAGQVDGENNQNRSLSWHARFYTDTTSIDMPNDNPYPYLFVQGGHNGQTWADVFHRYWQVKSQDEGLTVQTTTCLTDLPTVRDEGELSLKQIIFPYQGTANVGVPALLGVTLRTEQATANPLVRFTVHDASDNVVFSDTVAAGYLLTGTHYIEATELWTPTIASAFTLTVELDPDDRFEEQDESDNILTISDEVFTGSPFKMTATTRDGRQWLDTRTIELEVQSSVNSLDDLVVQVYEYVPGMSPNIQVPSMTHQVVLKSPTLPNVSLELPPEVKTGAIRLHLWGFAGGELSQPAIVDFSYHPSNRHVGYQSDFYRFKSRAGDRVEISLYVSAGEASLSVWDNPWTDRKLTLTAGQNHSIVIDPAPKRWLTVKVEGLTDDAEYTISTQRTAQASQLMNTQRNAQPSRLMSTALETEIEVEIVQEAELGLIEPLPELPLQNAFVTLQGRPAPPHERLSVPLSVSLTVPGEDVPSYEFEVMTDENGHFTLMGIEPGSYEMRVKKSTTLQNLLTVDIQAGSNTLNVGTLREGDANNDNAVTILDFSILASTFGKCEEGAGYDERADFNGDGCVTILDFSLLASNFGQAGDMTPNSIPSHLRQLAEEATLVVEPDTTSVAVGENLTMTVLVEAVGTIDGAQACLNFDPTLLQVRQISRGSALPLELANQFDNSTGSISLAAGALSDFPSGTIQLAELEFEALAQSDGTELAFQFDMACESDVTFGGASVLSSHTNGTIIVKQAPTAVTVGNLTTPSLSTSWLWALLPMLTILAAIWVSRLVRVRG